MHFVHNNCQGHFEPRFVCRYCKTEIKSDDTESHPGPGAGTEPAHVGETQRQIKLRGSLGEHKTSGKVGVEGDRGTTKFGEYRAQLLIAPNTLPKRLDMLTNLKLLIKSEYQSGPNRYQYKLTKKGKSFYPVIVTLMEFGDRWLSKEGPPIILHHRICGHALSSIILCGQCDEAINLSEITFLED